jgi:non-ribosomal peptide synthetase component F
MNNLDASHLDAQEPFVGIVEAIESLARQTPDAAALLLPERQLTYGQLIEAVHAIAHKMLSSGVRPGQILGMSMMQTPLHLMTMLAQCHCRYISPCRKRSAESWRSASARAQSFPDSLRCVCTECRLLT